MHYLLIQDVDVGNYNWVHFAEKKYAEEQEDVEHRRAQQTRLYN